MIRSLQGPLTRKDNEVSNPDAVVDIFKQYILVLPSCVAIVWNPLSRVIDLEDDALIQRRRDEKSFFFDSAMIQK